MRYVLVPWRVNLPGFWPNMRTIVSEIWQGPANGQQERKGQLQAREMGQAAAELWRQGSTANSSHTLTIGSSVCKEVDAILHMSTEVRVSKEVSEGRDRMMMVWVERRTLPPSTTMSEPLTRPYLIAPQHTTASKPN